MTKSESIAKLAEALAKAQGEIKGALKDSSNPFFKSSYADLASVWDACRGPLSANGLAVIQTTDNRENGLVVETTLAHSSGEWVGGSLYIRPMKDDPQGVGSAITYARRYALAAMVGVAPEDDDGNAASGKGGDAVQKKLDVLDKLYGPPPEDTVNSILTPPDPLQATNTALTNRILKAIKDAKGEPGKLHRIQVKMTEKLTTGELLKESYDKLMEAVNG